MPLRFKLAKKIIKWGTRKSNSNFKLLSNTCQRILTREKDLTSTKIDLTRMFAPKTKVMLATAEAQSTTETSSTKQVSNP